MHAGVITAIRCPIVTAFAPWIFPWMTHFLRSNIHHGSQNCDLPPFLSKFLTIWGSWGGVRTVSLKFPAGCFILESFSVSSYVLGLCLLNRRNSRGALYNISRFCARLDGPLQTVLYKTFALGRSSTLGNEMNKR